MKDLEFPATIRNTEDGLFIDVPKKWASKLGLDPNQGPHRFSEHFNNKPLYFNVTGADTEQRAGELDEAIQE